MVVPCIHRLSQEGPESRCLRIWVPWAWDHDCRPGKSANMRIGGGGGVVLGRGTTVQGTLSSLWMVPGRHEAEGCFVAFALEARRVVRVGAGL